VNGLLKGEHTVIQVPSKCDYAGLLDIDDVPVETPEHRACRQAVGEAMLRHDCHERFGVCLLHRHFLMEDDGEVLAAYMDDAGVETVRSVPLSENLTPTAFRFDPAGGLVGLEYDESEHPPLTQEETRCLDEVFGILRDHGCLDRFGITILTDLGIPDDQAMLEVVTGRSMVTGPVPVTDERLKSSVETEWHFNLGEGGRCVQYCRKNCWNTPYGHQSQGHERVGS
jgi:hypothetical protein